MPKFTKTHALILLLGGIGVLVYNLLDYQQSYGHYWYSDGTKLLIAAGAVMTVAGALLYRRTSN
jgi:hypothetical protein